MLGLCPKHIINASFGYCTKVNAKGSMIYNNYKNILIKLLNKLRYISLCKSNNLKIVN